MSGKTTAATPNAAFMQDILRETGVNANLCYQCRKCSAGCPMSWAMDYSPAQIIHAIRLGLEDKVLSSKTMWLCSACMTCSTRCPQEVDIARLMDACKIIAIRKGYKSPISRVRKFNSAAMRNVMWFGRMYELGMIGDLKLRTLEFFTDVGLGIKMLLKGKLSIIPSLSLSRSITTWNIFSKVKAKDKEAHR
ncbi:MAG: 4Fe-4S dicluster domain-containing protein [Candidatus Brocadiia bacterium]